MAAPGAWHPAILRHPANGRATLYLGRGATPMSKLFARGVRRDPGGAWAHIIQRRFIYEHVWKLGDLVMWDNRSTRHRRDEFEAQRFASCIAPRSRERTRPVAFAA